ncbi:putative Starch synthase [uncultured Desulfobacterium sp.]|uniref:starch synthase n=1 Tax=uncultured Desulfobacterium sp. TaxID=201089 RepID=A0A445MXM2_9BACT|nr:putative Starch synthase [uncultured Desulfobacterium sp.]
MQFIKKPEQGKKIIVFIGLEGWSKKGGQGDYIRELSDAMSEAGHSVIVINPYFRQPHADISIKRGKFLFKVDLPVGQGTLPFNIFHNRIGKVHYLRFKDPHDILYPIIYPDWYVDGALYSDSLYGYIEAVCLSRIPMHIIGALGISPDILHFNDWQTGYGPAYMEIIYRYHQDFKSLLFRTGTVMTVHNIAYQGLTKWGLFINKADPICRLLENIFPPDGLFIGVYDHGYVYEVDAFGITGLPRHFQFMRDGGAECWGDVPGYGGRHNVLKFGLEKANKIIAVSKGNFHDMQRDDLGFGLSWVVRKRAAEGDIGFVWNGVDFDSICPEDLGELTETVNAKKNIKFVQYGSQDADILAKKMTNKLALRARVNDLINKSPEDCFGHIDDSNGDDLVVCAVSRFVRQKGYSILFEHLDYNYELDIRYNERLADALMRIRGEHGNRLQLIIMGTPGDGDGAWVLGRIKELTQQYKGRVALICKFDPALANQIRAGSNIFFMPSQYEPGGISNIQAAVLGTLCVLTYTGGLVDFIEAGGTYPEFVAAGFGYGVPWTLKRTGQDFVRAFRKALQIYCEDKVKWQALVKQAMTIKVDWSYRVPEYIYIYDSAMLRNDAIRNP